MIWAENIKLSKLSISYYRSKATRRCLLVFLVVAFASALYTYINYLEVQELQERSKGNTTQINRLSQTNQQALNYQAEIQSYEAQLNKINGFLSKEIDVTGLINSIVELKPVTMEISEISLKENLNLQTKMPFELNIQGVTTDLEAIELYKEDIVKVLGSDYQLETEASLLSTYNYNYKIKTAINK